MVILENQEISSLEKIKTTLMPIIDDQFTVLQETLSIDEAKKIPTPIKARYVCKKGIVYLFKNNDTIERIGSLEYWNRIEKFRTTKEVRLNTSIKNIHCPLNCGLCQRHKNTTGLLNVVVTNRCNLRCWYCFFYSEKAGYVYEPTIKQIEEMIISAKKINGFTPPIQLTGGEPSMRKDLSQIIAKAKELGSPHIQLNTASQILGMKYYLEMYSIGPDMNIKKVDSKIKRYIESYCIVEGNRIKSIVDEVAEWRKAGLNTIYTSFDSVKEKSNSYKNHFEMPFAIEAYSKGELRSIVLVPTVHNENLEDMRDVIKFAAMHANKGIKSVNFQPISLVGLAKKSEREKLRVTQSDIVDQLKPLGLKMENWYPISAVAVLADLISDERMHVRFYNNEKCGIATYAYVDAKREHGNPCDYKLIPINRFIDVERFLKNLYKRDKSTMYNLWYGLTLVPGFIRYLDARKALAKRLHGYIIEDELPNGVKISDIFDEIIVKGDYSSLGKFHQHFLFIGMMHFMDPFNYDINRVQRCSIHYGSLDGRVIPFCTYNVFPHIYRDEILKANKIKDKALEDKLKKEEVEKAKCVIEFRKDKIKEIKNSDIYKSYYRRLL